ncbi:apolipoprotein N-acyltransferase [Marinobacter daqiaonensis]|uniref:Apolipoprotein N-acyltransferase n=1 Tax=Marinobacter daqiaonensis TaxID=650891 RepID=A0A1I6JVU2_9GAMM|nr:apolipoprotein N-acyltransferase [Marinobacter daqiaonensis]SFR83067.1 apolipoprotein N-acyltransferase [Marinobacter daqiaonensis]
MRCQVPPVFRSWLPSLGAVLTGVLVATPVNYAGLYPLTWVAFVPFLLILRGKSLRAAYGLGLLCGLSLFLVGTSWMVEFLQRLKDYSFGPALAGSVLFWLLSAHLTALLAVTYRLLQRWLGDYSLWLFPILLMLFFGWFPVLFPLQLGESQSAFLPAIQGVAWTGVYGLDFMIGLSNALVAAAWQQRSGRSPALESRTSALVGVLGVVMLAVWLGYGWWALSRWDQQVAGWPEFTAGLVQSNETPSAAVPPPEPGFARAWPPEMEISHRLADEGAQVILWPETRYKGYFERDYVRLAYGRNVADLGVPLVFHDAEQQGEGADFREHNTAVLLGSGGQLEERYRKHRLVAFGETLPLSGEFPWLMRWVKRYLGEFFADLTPGEERTHFPVAGVNLVPAICYESAFPGHIARSVAETPSSPILVILSNNGWFGDSRMPWQHAGATVLRAVENRVSLVHVINNGPSMVVSPSGRVLAQTPFRKRTGMLVPVPYTPPGEGFASWFTKWPEWFPVTGLAFLLLALAVARFRRNPL